MLAAPAGASLRLRLLLAAAALLVTAVHERTASEQQDLEYIEGSYVCPGSPSAKPPASGSKSLNAWARISVSTSASCEDVRAEVLARLNGQIQGTWADPHNFGLYTILNKERANVLSLQRATGDRLFTDAVTLSFTADSDACIIHACSESQGGAGGDFSTNYCNSRMLLCGSALAGCQVVGADLAFEEVEVRTSRGATADAAACNHGLNVGKLQACRAAKNVTQCRAGWDQKAAAAVVADASCAANDRCR